MAFPAVASDSDCLVVVLGNSCCGSIVTDVAAAGS